MSLRVAVTAAEAITALGDDCDSTFAHLVAGDTGFSDAERFDPTGAVNSRGGFFRRSQATTAELVRSLGARIAAEHGELVVERVYYAGTPDEVAPRVPDSVRRSGGSGPEVGGWDRIYTGACVSSSSALVDAATAIAQGWYQRILVMAARRIDSRTFHLFSAGGAMTADMVPRPLTAGRSGVLLGDGAAAILLEAEDAVDRRTPHVELSGWGRTGDGFHAFQPEPNGRGMVLAIRQALAVADLNHTDIDAISVHGTGTMLSDASEAAALIATFGVESVPPVHAPKSAFGHTLEAAGLVEAVIAARVVTASTLPPLCGIRPGDQPLLTAITPRAAAAAVRHVLTTNLAFGGTNTAIVFSRWRTDDHRESSPGPPLGARRPPAPRRRAIVGTRTDMPVVPGFIQSSYPPAIYDAAHRCLGAAALSPEDRAATGVLVLAPCGDRETKDAVSSYLRDGLRLPPPLFVQSTPSSIVGRIARDWQLGRGVSIVSTARALHDPVVLDMATEMAVADSARAILVIRHVAGAEGEPGTAEAAVYVVEHVGAHRSRVGHATRSPRC